MSNDKNISDEKAARLAAIRAANAAKSIPKSAVSSEAATVQKVETTVSDEKAARLAAIRAANVSKKQEQDVVPAPTLVETPSTKTVSDEKAARLAAIRAANVSKQHGGETIPSQKEATPVAAAKPIAAASPSPVAKPVPAAAQASHALTPSSKPINMIGLMVRLVVGAIIGVAALGLLSTTTMHYQSMQLAMAFGAIFGAVSAYVAGMWPPSPGDETTE